MSDNPAVSTIGEANSAVYFTREQFAAGLRFPVSSLVKQFLHVSRAPPALIHLNVIRILMGCSVLVPVGYLIGGDLLCLYIEA